LHTILTNESKIKKAETPLFIDVSANWIFDISKQLKVGDIHQISGFLILFYK